MAPACSFLFRFFHKMDVKTVRFLMWWQDGWSADEAGVFQPHGVQRRGGHEETRVISCGLKQLLFCSLLCTWHGSLAHGGTAQLWFLSCWFLPLPRRTRPPVYTGARSYSCSGSLLFASQCSQTLDSGGRSGKRKRADLLQLVFRLTPWEIERKTFFFLFTMT